MVIEENRRAIEREVRTRMAELAASAGLGSTQVALQALYLMPGDFMDAYAALFHRALRVAGDVGRPSEEGREDADGKATTVQRVSASRTSRMREGATLGGMGPAKSTGKRHRRVWTVADEKALSRKEAVDKKLRKITREMLAGMTEDLKSQESGGGDAADRGGDAVARCKGRKCGKFMDAEWVFCPSCGTQAKTKIENSRDRGEG